jgi:hypothetical protein
MQGTVMAMETQGTQDTGTYRIASRFEATLREGRGRSRDGKIPYFIVVYRTVQNTIHTIPGIVHAWHSATNHTDIDG